MKKFVVIFISLVLLFSIVLCLPGKAEAEPAQLCSGYYGINRQTGLMGLILPGTDQEALFSRILPSGQLGLSSGVATGSVLTLSRDGTVVDELSLAVLSDCSGDGAFSVSDMLMVKSNLLNLKQFTPAQAQAADVNGDGAVTITDFLQMKSKVLGLTDFSIRIVDGAETVSSRILGLGDTCSFGPKHSNLADPVCVPIGDAASDPTGASSVPTEPSSEPTEPSSEPTEPSSEPTEPSSEPTEPSSEPTEPSSEPTEPSSEPTEPTPPKPVDTVTVEGDAVTWNEGKVTAVKVGTARLTYKGESLVITVCKESLKVSLPGDTLFVAPGASTPLQTAINHPLAHEVITYAVEDPSIATVDSRGVITGVATGNTKVTVTLPGGSHATQKIKVIQLVETLRLDEDYIKIKPGSTRQLEATIKPKKSPEKLIWTSSDPSIATVSSKGLVTGVKKGTVTITCTTKYGNIAASCKVKVCNVIQVALTFDDGPSSSYTPKVLDLLKKYDVKATFFLVGNRISTSPGSVKRMAEEGHEIGYHTWAHSYFSTMSSGTIQADLAKFQTAVKNASGKTATVYRAPGGGITGNALRTINMPHIMWSIDTRDWETRNSWSVKNAIIGGLKDGAIILLHDIHGTTYLGTVAALDYIFANDLDVEFLTVTELLSRKGTPPTAGKTYYWG